MADLGLPQIDASSITGAITGVTTAIQWIVGVVIIGAVIFLILEVRKYKHKIRVKVLTGSKHYIEDDRFKEVKTRDGRIKLWKLLWRRDEIPPSPPDCISITKKGRMAVETFYTEEGQYQYSKTEINEDAIKNAGTTAEEKQKKFFSSTKNRYIYIEDANESVEAISPVTTNQRLFLANQIKKAHSRKPIKFTEYIPTIASGVVLIIIFVLAVSFWDDITAPSVAVVSQAAIMMEESSQITGQQEQMLHWMSRIMIEKELIRPDEAYNYTMTIE